MTRDPASDDVRKAQSTRMQHASNSQPLAPSSRNSHAADEQAATDDAERFPADLDRCDEIPTDEQAATDDAKRSSRRRISSRWLILPIAALSLAAAFLSLARGNALLLGMVLVLLSMVPFLMRFERRERQAREMVLIASMAAIATVSRIPFAILLPGFTPATFIVIVSGVVFGAEAGWMIGAVTGLVSNMFLGQGPWTPWQMFAWGMAGFTAGLFAHRRPLRSNRWTLALFGAAWGFLFGWIMNLSIALDVWVKEQSWLSVMSVYALSLPFDLMHAAACTIFLAIFAPSWIQLLQRYRRKYGAIERVYTGACADEEEIVDGQQSTDIDRRRAGGSAEQS